MIRRHVRGFIARRLSSEEYLGLHLTVGLLVCLVLVGAFGFLAHAVVGERALTEFDTRIGLQLAAHRQAAPRLRQTFIVFTEIGSPEAMVCLTVLVALALLIRRRRVLALVWLLALISTAVLNLALKSVVARDRPPFRDPIIDEPTHSFPSGHSMGAVVAFGLLAYFLLLALSDRREKVLVVVVAVLLTLAIGFSRIYLGAHYFSDVVGGYTVGGAWLSVCISAIEVARRRARIHKRLAARTHAKAEAAVDPPASGPPLPGTPGRGAGGEGQRPETVGSQNPLTPDPSPRSTGERGAERESLRSDLFPAPPEITPMPSRLCLTIASSLVLLLAPAGHGGAPQTDSPDPRLPKNAVARLGTLRFRHPGPVSALAYSRDGRLIATACNDRLIRLWDAASGTAVRVLKGHEAEVRCLAFSPDGKTLASGGGDKAVRLWDVNTGTERRRFLNHADWVEAIAFSPDGKVLASGSCDASLLLWDLVADKPAHRLTQPGGIKAIAFSPDSKTVAAGGSDETLILWDVATGTAVRRILGRWVASLAFSPDGTTLAVGPYHTNVALYEVASGKELHQLAGHQPVRRRGAAILGVAFSPDGKTLASAGTDGTLRLWDPALGKETRKIEGHGQPITCLAFAPDGKTLAAGDFGHAVALWDSITGKERDPLPGHHGAIVTLAVAPDGKLLATGSPDGTVILWDATGKQRRTVTPGAAVGSVTFSADGKRLAIGTSDGLVRLWDADGSRELFRLEGHRGSVSALCFTTSGDLLSGSQDHTLRLWDLEKKKEVRQLGRLGGPVVALALTGDGRTVACAGGDNVLRLFDLGSGEEVRSFGGQSGGVTALAMSPDGRTLITGGRDRTARLWEVSTGKERLVLKGHGGWVEAVALSPDGRVLATGASDGVVRLWGLAGGKSIAEWNGHRAAVKSLAFSPKADLLISGAADTTALLWDAAALLRGAKFHPAALKPEQLDACWTDLAADDAERAFRAINTLFRSGDQAVALLKKNLQPVTGDSVAKLIARLDDDDFATREKARGELARLGNHVEPALRRALADNPSAEVQRRLGDLLKALAERRLEPEVARGLRGVEVLERIGSADAREVLRGLAKGVPEAELTVEAKAALERLGK